MALHALGDVRADGRTTTEIADALLQKAEVPFRAGRHFASKLTAQEFREVISAKYMVFGRKGLGGTAGSGSATLS
jgi:hypothetical protein